MNKVTIHWDYIIMWALIIFLVISTLTGCTTAPCPPKSDTEIIADTIKGILVPSIEIGC